MALRIHLLGQMCLEVGDEVVPASALPGRQGRIAFAYLALARHPTSRDEVAEVVWPDELPKSWERDLSAIVSKLKALLSRVGLPDAIHSALGCYELVLPPDAEIDVESARTHIEDAESSLRRQDAAGAWGAASAAFNLATRPFLPGERGEWVESNRDALTKLAVRAADALVVTESSRARWSEAAQYAEEAIARAPYRESGYAALVDVHIGAGNRAEALRVYERARSLLVEELGVPPSASLEAAYRRALAADAPREAQHVPVAGTVSLVFTDLVGSTELADRLGADESEIIRRAHFRVLRDAIATTGGHEIKNLGDGLMIAFSRARDALTCAVAMQEAVDRNNRTEPGPELATRVGVHVGEPVIDGGDYFGMPVVVARRLCDRAGPGEILASQLACALADAEDGFDLGPVVDVALKGIEQPVAVRRVQWAPIADKPLPLPSLLVAGREEFDFVGREQELASLLRAVPVGPVLPQLVLVAGEPGVGKTRLLVETARRAADKGATVLWGRCAQETTVAYQPFVEALDHVVAASPLHELRALTGQGTADLAILLPRLSERLPVDRAGADEPDRRVLFDAVARCLTALAARRPLMVVIDDLHWADAPTMQLLAHLMRNVESVPIVFVASARTATGEWAPSALDGHAELARTGRLARVDLAGMTESEVLALLRMDDARLHPEGFALARSLHATTAGNPFFVREIVHHLQATGRLSVVEGRWLIDDPHGPLAVPSGVVAMVGQRIARLPEAARELLGLAAVVGIEFDVAVLVELTEHGEDFVIDSLEQAVDAQLIVEAAGVMDRFAFTHALVREAVERTITASRRLRMHKRIAEALERMGDATRVAELAQHWCAAGTVGDLGRAVAYARRAGDEAMGRLAYEAAAQHYDAALEALRQQPESSYAEELALLLALGDSRARAGDVRLGRHWRGTRTADTYRAAADLARAHSDAIGFSRAVIGLTSEWILTGVVDAERLELIEEAIERLGDADLVERAALLGQLAGEQYYLRDMAVRRDELSAEAVTIARRVGDPVVLGNALDRRNYAMWAPDGAAERADSGREIVVLARQAGNLELELRGHDWIMIGAGALGDFRRYDDALAAFERVADELRRPRHQWYAHTRRAGRTALAGDLDDAMRLGRRALDEGLRLGEEDALGVYTGGMWPVWLERPDEAAVRAQDELLARYQAGGSADDGLPALIHRVCRAVVLELIGDHERAIAEFDWYRRRGLLSIPRDYGWSLTIPNLCRMVSMVGTPEEAALLYADVLPFAGGMVPMAGSMWNGAWSHLLGSLAARMERWDDAVRHFDDGIALYRIIGAKSFLARAELELARTLCHTGDARRTRDLVASASAAAAQLGLPLIVNEAELLQP